MPDSFESVRSLPFTVLASALGISLEKFKRKGNEWVGPCPYHKPKNNTGCFRYHDDGRYNCFVCLKGFSGRGAIDFTKAMTQSGFQAAVDLLTPYARKEPPKQKEPPISDSQASSDDSGGELKPLKSDSWRKFAVPCPWLESRIPDAAVRERYGAFCYNNPARRSAYSNRVMIPVKNPEGVLYGYLGRAVEGEPKYLFPKALPKSKFLFGSDILKAGKFGPLPLKRVYLVESPFCVMRFAMLGLPAVAAYGWSVSELQIEILRQIARGVVWLPDANKRQDAMSHVSALATKLWLRFPELPAQIQDPETLTKEQVLALTH